MQDPRMEDLFERQHRIAEKAAAMDLERNATSDNERLQAIAEREKLVAQRRESQQQGTDGHNLAAKRQVVPQGTDGLEQPQHALESKKRPAVHDPRTKELFERHHQAAEEAATSSLEGTVASDDERIQAIAERERLVAQRCESQQQGTDDHDLAVTHQVVSQGIDVFEQPPHSLETAKISTTGTAPYSTGPLSNNKGLPSLYECANQLKQRTHLICYRGNLYVYNGKCFDFLYPDDIIRLYRETVDDQLGGAKGLGCITQLHKFLRTDSNLQIYELKGNQRIAVLENGIFDVMTGKLREHNYKEVTFSSIKAQYREKAKCQTFRQFLRAVTHGDEILQERLWQFLGYMLLQTNEGKVFFVMGTAPDSGKSVLGNFIESLFDERYVSNIALNDFNRSFASAPIVGSAINVSLDLPATKLKPSAVSQIKMLTGGDAFSVNQKFVPVFRYRNRAKLLFASNFPIELSEYDDAFWNRLVYLPFDFSIPKADQNADLINMLQEEKDAIVSEALRHAKILIENNFCFPTTPLIERRMEEWQGRTNPSIENFLKDCCLIDESYRGELTETLFSAYQQYCDSTGLVAKSRPFFKKFLENEIDLKHFKMRDGGENPQSAFRNIKLKGGSMS